ncbi:MAG: BatD family protein [Verrucomicrobiae bacterium]|nr:BatD family protein [Verrucomicrobiae bacterium]
MKALPKFVALALWLNQMTVWAEVAPVVVKLPDDPKAWTGQRLLFRVDLRSHGSFGGSTSFTLPKVPGTVIMKPGNATVSSEQIEGESWFIQSHSFALFSQNEGVVSVPSFSVRFGTREGFTGPVTEVEAEVPGFDVTIERPPGTKGLGFLITADSLRVEERWDPVPGIETIETGAIFKRTITQHAENLTGMALAPIPKDVPEGIRVYPGQAAVQDQTERGSFRGERVETITYFVEAPGSHTFPEIRYSWWNPAKNVVESKTLPTVTIQAKAAPSPALAENRRHLAVLGFAVVLAIMALGYWQRNWLAALVKQAKSRLRSPEKAAARQLLRACRGNDAESALNAWYVWKQCREDRPVVTELRDEIQRLQLALFGVAPDASSWQGKRLADLVRRHRSSRHECPGPLQSSALHPLNP